MAVIQKVARMDQANRITSQTMESVWGIGMMDWNRFPFFFLSRFSFEENSFSFFLSITLILHLCISSVVLFIALLSLSAYLAYLEHSQWSVKSGFGWMTERAWFWVKMKAVTQLWFSSCFLPWAPCWHDSTVEYVCVWGGSPVVGGSG